MTMKTILGNFLTQPNRDFPLDCETLDYLQTLTAMTAIIGNVAGDKTVLYGCEPNSDGTRRSAGYVFLRTKAQPEGEVLYWEGGPTSGGMYLKQEDVPVNANNTAYPKAYTRRTLAPGLGEEGYNWADFTDIKTIKELMAEDKALLEKLAGIQQEPPGIIKMWAGQSVPEGYLLCNGAQYSITDYPELYSVLGNSFNTALSASGQPYTTQSGFFRVPDLQGRFVVGRHESDNDYRTMGQGGGFKSVALEENQMPKHKHSLKDYYYAENRNWCRGTYDVNPINGNVGSNNTNYDNDALQYYVHDTETTGQGASHENRPPYYVLAYIIRAK